MPKLLIVESVTDELIPEMYRDSWGIESKTIWDTIEASEADFQRYEELRIALDELKEEIRKKSKGLIECPNHQGNFDCTPFCPLCHGEQETTNG